jgi:hypothetical protein
MNFNSDTIEKINDILQLDTTQLNTINCDEALNKLYNKYKSLEETFIINLPKEYNDKREFSTSIKELRNLRERLTFLRKEELSFKNLVKKWKVQGNSEKLNEITGKVFKKIYLERQVSYYSGLKELENKRYFIQKYGNFF